MAKEGKFHESLSLILITILGFVHMAKECKFHESLSLILITILGFVHMAKEGKFYEYLHLVLVTALDCSDGDGRYEYLATHKSYCAC